MYRIRWKTIGLIALILILALLYKPAHYQLLNIDHAYFVEDLTGLIIFVSLIIGIALIGLIKLIRRKREDRQFNNKNHLERRVK